jgi:uridylate kinase
VTVGEGDRPWRRVLVKISGEALSGEGRGGIHGEAVHALARELADAAETGVEIAVVNGGGNIVRGAQMAITGIGRATADTMGMLATVINALALQDVLESLGRPTRVLSAIEMRGVAEPYIRRRAMRHLEKGRVILLAGGSGHPYFSTDTAAALRGSEIGAQVLLKATKVDGVYDKDPKRHGNASRFETMGFDEVYERRLEVMDRTAITMCQEHALPIVVFDMAVKGNLTRLLRGERVGTRIGFPSRA